MDAIALQVIAGVILPGTAIIISTLVAVGLARSERTAAAAARVEERADAAFVRTLVALAMLNTINLRDESVAEPLRELRIGLTLLAAVSSQRDNDLVAEWFEAERVAGLVQTKESMQNLELAPQSPSSDADVESIVAASEPLNGWARDFANNIRLWRRNGASDAALKALITSAKSRH
ncbi:MAG: hypothetical protein ACOH14_05915 [Rhodoglobus sp.]